MTKEQEAAGKGAEFLDHEVPGWYQRIDLASLNIDSCLDCVLGQLYGDYEAGIEEVFGWNIREEDETIYERAEMGFTSINKQYDIVSLTFAWRQEIEDRLTEDAA